MNQMLVRTVNSLAIVSTIALVPALAAGEPTPAGLAEKTRDALLEAIDGERRAEGYYRAVLERHGAEVMPFAVAVESERRRTAELEAVSRQHDVDVPAPADDTAFDVPDTMKEACVVAMQATKEKVAMYAGFLEFVTDPQIRSTFERLRAVAADRQLAAFRSCVDNDGRFLGRQAVAGGCGGGCGMGKACGCASAPEPKRADGGCGCAKRRPLQQQPE